MYDLTLTFDNGPDPDVTPRVLEILRERSILATFFVVGRQVSASAGRDLVRATLRDGHWVGNHTFSHTTPLGEDPTPDVVETEIVSTARLLEECGVTSRLFRPFGGGGNLDRRLLRPAVVDHLMAEGYSCVLWNAIPRDWADPEGWVERALDQCWRQPWTLIVLHDLPTGAMDHLERFLDRATEAGARFRQDFPPDCVPIQRGTVIRSVEDYTSALA